jgi:hypothetical protein
MYKYRMNENLLINLSTKHNNIYYDHLSMRIQSLMKILITLSFIKKNNKKKI